MERGLCMRKNSDGRGEVQTRRYASGEVVFGAIDGYPGRVISLDPDTRTVTVQWDEGGLPVVYPMDTIMIRKRWPWE